MRSSHPLRYIKVSQSAWSLSRNASNRPTGLFVMVEREQRALRLFDKANDLDSHYIPGDLFPLSRYHSLRGPF